MALQGAVSLHKPHIEACGAEFRAVKTCAEINAVDALILPGGESTTMLKLIDTFGLWDGLLQNFTTKPVWGICAGAILLAKMVTNPAQKSFGILPMTIQRNAYGRQLESHFADIQGYEVSFIRAPVITDIDPAMEVLATHQGQNVWVRHGHAMATTFHPETNTAAPSPMHRMFIDFVRKNA